MTQPVMFLTILLSCCLGCSLPIGLPAVSNSSFELHSDLIYSVTKLTGDLYVPNGSGPYPAVLLIHPGSWSGGKRSRMNGIAKQLVANGFVAFNISYNFAPEHHFPSQLDDCKDAVRWMRANATKYKIAPQKIAAFGFSAGGHLAALLGMRDSDPDAMVQAVVSGSAPLNLFKDPYNPAVIKFLGTTINELPDRFSEASPIFHVTPGDPPIFMYHGTEDRTVNVSHTLDMKVALDKVSVKNEVYLVENYGHTLLFLFATSPIKRAIAFLQERFH